MKKILLLGAGLVTRPLVRYLLDQPNFQLTVASRTVAKAEQLIDKHPRGVARAIDVTRENALLEVVPAADLVISLLPYVYHVQVAKLCVEYRKHLVTTSYVSPKMQELHEAALKAKVLLLNEIGLDPGIDHMSAMKIINDIKAKGGQVTSFRSYCGGLPAPEANTNPLGYKFSWSPRGVLLAGKNAARFLENGAEVFIEGPDLFNHFETVTIEGYGQFEGYPNRNSMGYIDLYNLHGTKTMFRGTLRNLTHCRFWKKMVDLGLLDETVRTIPDGMTYRAFMGSLLPSPALNVEEAIAHHLGLALDSLEMKKFRWLGLFDELPIPIKEISAIDILGGRMLEKMQYEPGERDMVVLHHEFIAEYPTKPAEKITSTLVDFGIPNGDSSMARTVGLPAAIATKLILSGVIKDIGVKIPVDATLYEPVLSELEHLGIAFAEHHYPVK